MKNFSFGNYICELREKKGLSQSQLGEKLGVTNKAVSRWENGGAYPSTELMLPLAKELGVTIEDLYKVIYEDKTPKTKLRKFLEYLMQHSKLITIICLALSVIPYLLFVCFSTIEDKMSLTILTPIVSVILYFMIYFMFVWTRRNPFSSGKAMDVYTMIFLGIMPIAYISVLATSVVNFPNNFDFSLSMPSIVFMAAIHSLKRRYK